VILIEAERIGQRALGLVPTDENQVRRFIIHSHFDHLGDVPYIARKTGANVIGHETARALSLGSTVITPVHLEPIVIR